jgi:hypothetical protein
MIVSVVIQSSASTVVASGIGRHPPKRDLGFAEGSCKCRMSSNGRLYER